LGAGVSALVFNSIILMNTWNVNIRARSVLSSQKKRMLKTEAISMEPI